MADWLLLRHSFRTEVVRGDLDGEVPDRSTFSKNRHGRFRDCDLLRKLFETVVRRCMAEGLVDGAAFAVDASLIAADANKQRSAAGSDDVDWEAIARMRLLGARQARRYRSSSPGPIRPHNGPALTKGMPSFVYTDPNSHKVYYGI